jgi:hypothetical protein
VQQRSTTTGHHTLLNSSKGGVLGVLNAQLAVLQLSLCGSTNLGWMIVVAAAEQAQLSV